MKPVLQFIALVALLLLAGCGPAEAPPPPAPVKSEIELKREKYFGVQVATDSSVDWRSTGLGVKILAAGDGPFVRFSDRVRVH